MEGVIFSWTFPSSLQADDSGHVRDFYEPLGCRPIPICNGDCLPVKSWCFSWDFMGNVNPGLINPVYGWLLGWYHKEVLDDMTIGGVPPNFHKPWFINLLIRG